MIISEPKYAEQLAQLHISALPESFLGSLGEGFLTLVYKQLISDTEIITVAEIKDDKVVGFITAGSGLRRIYFKLIWKPLPTMMALLRSRISLQKLGGIVEVVRYTFSTRAPHKTAARTDISSELYLLAVDPQYRRRGIASKLLNELICSFSEAGIREFKVLVSEQLEGAQKFYEGHGLQRRSCFLHHGRHAIEYLKKIHD